MCERNIHWLPLARPPLGTWPATQACALTGDQIGNLSVYKITCNSLSHTSQGSFSYFKTGSIIVPASQRYSVCINNDIIKQILKITPGIIQMTQLSLLGVLPLLYFLNRSFVPYVVSVCTFLSLGFLLVSLFLSFKSLLKCYLLREALLTA